MCGWRSGRFVCCSEHAAHAWGVSVVSEIDGGSLYRNE